MSWPCINPDCTLDRGHGTACQPFTTHTFTDLELAARDARIRADIVAEVLGTIEFIAAICEAREMLAPGDRDIQTIKGIADAVLSTAKADE